MLPLLKKSFFFSFFRTKTKIYEEDSEKSKRKPFLCIVKQGIENVGCTWYTLGRIVIATSSVAGDCGSLSNPLSNYLVSLQRMDR